MRTVLPTSLISHAAGNKNGISINQERSACRERGDWWLVVKRRVCVCVCGLAQAMCHHIL